jgi:hypothetical protein
MRQLLYLAFCCLALSTDHIAMAGGSQAPPDDRTTAQWQRVQSLLPGVQLQVRRLDKTTVKGSFVSADDSAITVKAEIGESRIARSDIRQVRAKRGSARLKGGAIGAAIGAAGGIAIAVALGGALTDGDGVSSEAAAALGALGGGIGLAVGLIPTGYTKIYDAR